MWHLEELALKRDLPTCADTGLVGLHSAAWSCRDHEGQASGPTSTLCTVLEARCWSGMPTASCRCSSRSEALLADLRSPSRCPPH